jgi:hypothetical protein
MAPAYYNTCQATSFALGYDGVLRCLLGLLRRDKVMCEHRRRSYLKSKNDIAIDQGAPYKLTPAPGFSVGKEGPG